MHFRKASPGDLPKLKQIAEAVIRHNYVPFLGLDATTSFIESGESDKEIEDGIGSCIVLEEKNDIVAFAITKDNLLHLLMVDVPFQNAGYGKVLLTHIEAELFQKYPCIHLQTFAGNRVAKRFYMKNGWHLTEHPNPDDTMLQMYKMRDKHELDG